MSIEDRAARSGPLARQREHECRPACESSRRTEEPREASTARRSGSSEADTHWRGFGVGGPDGGRGPKTRQSVLEAPC